MQYKNAHRVVVVARVPDKIFLNIPDYWLHDHTGNMIKSLRMKLIKCGVLDWPKIHLEPGILAVEARAVDDHAIADIQNLCAAILRRVIEDASRS